MQRAPADDDGGRLPLLDLVRGLAVLGILAINLGGFAGPMSATLSPNLPEPGSWADELWFAGSLLLFEGKMRALFTLLFGASMLLFIDRADARGQQGEHLQFRRLGWLAGFGYLHFLLWWGDILFTYAVAGFAALAFRQAPPRWLAAGGLALFIAWHGLMAIQGAPDVAREQRVLSGSASHADTIHYAADRREDAIATTRELARDRLGLGAQVMAKLRDEPAEPIGGALNTVGESIPLMLIGMALWRSGFFAGAWPRRRLILLSAGGTASGGIVTAAFVAWALPLHFPPVLMLRALAYGLAIPHLLMALGYAATLVLFAPRLLRTALGRRLAAAGHMALSNYLGTTVVMTTVFYGWGLGLVGTVPERWFWLFLVGGWALMLAWSEPWLRRFRHGPLEWLWRSLTYGHPIPLRRERPDGGQPSLSVVP